MLFLQLDLRFASCIVVQRLTCQLLHDSSILADFWGIRLVIAIADSHLFNRPVIAAKVHSTHLCTGRCLLLKKIYYKGWLCTVAVITRRVLRSHIKLSGVLSRGHDVYQAIVDRLLSSIFRAAWIILGLRCSPLGGDALT